VALRPEIRELVLLFAQQAARDFLAAEADAASLKMPAPDTLPAPAPTPDRGHDG
jgi:hypothetical protein